MMMITATLLLSLLCLVSQQSVADGFAIPFQNARRGELAAVFNDDSCNDEPQQQELGKTRRDVFSVVAGTCFGGFVGNAHAAKAKDISGQDFSGQDLSNRDFTGVIAKKTNFSNCNLQGATFAKADLVGADFSGSDVRGATFVDAVLDGTSFANTLAQKSIWSKTILDIANLENTDMTDSLWPSTLRIMICDMDEVRGTNAITGVDSKDSLMCTDYTRRS